MIHFIPRLFSPRTGRPPSGTAGRVPLRLEELEPRDLPATPSVALAVPGPPAPVRSPAPPSANTLITQAAPDLIRVLSGAGPGVPAPAAPPPALAAAALPQTVAGTLTTNVPPPAPPGKRLDGGAGEELTGRQGENLDPGFQQAPGFEPVPGTTPAGPAPTNGPEPPLAPRTLAADVFFSTPVETPFVASPAAENDPQARREVDTPPGSQDPGVVPAALALVLAGHWADRRVERGKSPSGLSWDTA
jgi:hypothetical protein